MSLAVALTPMAIVSSLVIEEMVVLLNLGNRAEEADSDTLASLPTLLLNLLRHPVTRVLGQNPPLHVIVEL